MSATVDVPLPGSSLEHLERRGTWLVATLSAAEIGRVQLLFFNGEAHGNVASLPLALAAGTLDSPEGSLGSHIPMPFPREGAVELHLRGAQGELLTIVGQSLTVRPVEPSPAVVTLGRLPGGLR
ncbi:MAG TPA: hypothetical protein VKM72_03385 [Thermoanaerobaculia bacterium]|nr:hypothetical protein [Thermoanaerobaculia bacterium]